MIHIGTDDNLYRGFKGFKKVPNCSGIKVAGRFYGWIDDELWVLGNDKKIRKYPYRGGEYSVVPGEATDFDIDVDTIWKLGTDKVDEGYEVYKH